MCVCFQTLAEMTLKYSVCSKQRNIKVVAANKGWEVKLVRKNSYKFITAYPHTHTHTYLQHTYAYMNCVASSKGSSNESSTFLHFQPRCFNVANGASLHNEAQLSERGRVWGVPGGKSGAAFQFLRTLHGLIIKVFICTRTRAFKGLIKRISHSEIAHKRTHTHMADTKP